MLPHDCCHRGVEVQSRVEGVHGVFEGDVATVAGQESVISESVHHGARATDWFQDRQRWSMKGLYTEELVSNDMSCNTKCTLVVPTVLCIAHLSFR